ncbi:hypothetical protein NP233_g11945 [Leucocoprinus birnbaumii]|uniref:Nephrocystin 3-like N-terminal domain-containing protein n=1 Tax=Leucocoprinus birnbaumii TaxID=56174 RepID=A0AAD5VFG0_9AGAR|nr:hypothetical protein NP233_g11945 [Leucocoprinus birnbaumii]
MLQYHQIHPLEAISLSPSSFSLIELLCCPITSNESSLIVDVQTPTSTASQAHGNPLYALTLCFSTMQGSFIDPLSFRLREPTTYDATQYYSAGGGHEPENTNHAKAPYGQSVRAGTFQGAHHFVVQNQTMAEKIEYIFSGTSVMGIIYPFIDPNAALDSSARDPPPRCHPGTRVHINEDLIAWLNSPDRGFDMRWLCGPAGTGKSAIAQTFAEVCFELGRLGAAFFFSRPNGRDKSKTVIPSLVYQLCLHCPAYKVIVIEIIVNDPQLLQKAVGIQFKRLLIEPFVQLKMKGHPCSRQPLVIILDGLDECAGIPAQCLFIRLISEHVRLMRGFPLLWFLSSRQESHLKQSFSRITVCGRDELVFDQESRDDVKRYLRDQFIRAREENPYTTTPEWPPQAQLDDLVEMTSGYFQFAEIAVKYVNDPEVGDPVKQLNLLIAYLTTTQRIGVNNPLCILDALYTRILSNVPQEVLPTTLDILAQLALSSPHWSGKHMSAQVLCNVLRLEQHTFYGALAKLHSVILVPAPANACLESLRFYHASFPDYLLDTGRSGKFGITKSWAFEIMASRYLDWYEVLIASTNLNDFLNVADGCAEPVSVSLTRHVLGYAWQPFDWGSKCKSERVFSRLLDFDFRYINAHGRESVPWLVNWIHRHPSYPIDFELLEHVKHLTGEKSVIPGVKLPFPDFGRFMFPAFNLSRELLFLGCGQKTVAVLFTRSRNPSIDVINIEVGLSAELVSRYRRMIDQHDEPGWIEEIIEMFNEESLREALE